MLAQEKLFDPLPSSGYGEHPGAGSRKNLLMAPYCHGDFIPGFDQAARRLAVSDLTLLPLV